KLGLMATLLNIVLCCSTCAMLGRAHLKLPSKSKTRKKKYQASLSLRNLCWHRDTLIGFSYPSNVYFCKIHRKQFHPSPKSNGNSLSPRRSSQLNRSVSNENLSGI